MFDVKKESETTKLTDTTRLPVTKPEEDSQEESSSSCVATVYNLLRGTHELQQVRWLVVLSIGRHHYVGICQRRYIGGPTDSYSDFAPMEGTL